MTRTLFLSALFALLLAACGSGPGIPHEIESSTDSYCLGCHRDGTNGAPKTPHAGRSDCTSCHEPK